MTQDSANIQQRVWDAFPAYPGTTTMAALRQQLSWWPTDTIRRAVRSLKRLKCVENATFGVYRRVKNARRPVDMRGHHGNSGRKRNGQ